MKGFVIFNNLDGTLAYSRYFTPGILSKDGYKNLCFDQQEPAKIASQFFNIMQMGRIMEEEYHEEFPDDNDPCTRLAFLKSLQSYKSESVDYIVEHHDHFPLTIVLFYDERDLEEKITRFLTVRLLDIFCWKKAQLLHANENLKNDQASNDEFENAFALILENVSGIS